MQGEVLTPSQRFKVHRDSGVHSRPAGWVSRDLAGSTRVVTGKGKEVRQQTLMWGAGQVWTAAFEEWTPEGTMPPSPSSWAWSWATVPR